MFNILFSQSSVFTVLTMFDNSKIMYIMCAMVVLSTAGGSDEQRTREGNDGRVS